MSVGHGLPKDPTNLHVPGAHNLHWHQEVIRYLNASYPGEQVDYVHGARAATDTPHYEWCYPAHIGTDADLIMIEMAVNDAFEQPLFESTETLLRSLLSLRTAPAVIYVDSFSLRDAHGTRASLNGGDAHNHIALRYGVPQISLRSAALTSLMAHPDFVEPWFHGDDKHIGPEMHAMLGSMVVAYLQEEACQLAAGGWDAAAADWGDDAKHANLPGMDVLGAVPRNRIDEAWDCAGPPHSTAAPTCKLAARPGHRAELVPIEPVPSWSVYAWEVSPVVSFLRCVHPSGTRAVVC